MGQALLECAAHVDWAHGEGHTLPRARHGPRHRHRRRATEANRLQTQGRLFPFPKPWHALAFVSPPPSTTAPHYHEAPAPLARFLSVVRSLSPKIVVVAEQDADHNGVSFREAIHYYGAVFDSLDAAAVAAASHSHVWAADELAQVERVVVGEEMKGVLLREGARRRERHER
uniref:Uncharacterized protein n=1 Tax=Leersia perrieri TaxID=77586 RepID=A0A0D9XWS1_9ORYZ